MTNHPNEFDVNKLLSAIDNDDNENFLKLNKQLIQKYKNNILQQLQLSSEILKTYHKKLKHYRYVEELTDIKYGNYIRWINIKNPENLYLTNGGLIMDVNFFNDGVQIKCKNNRNRFFNIKFDECVIFQKLTDQERILLEIMENLRK
jgi:hypothetical protein